MIPSETRRAWLAHRHLPPFLACLAMFLTLPSLWIGWNVDDYAHRVMLLGLPTIPEEYAEYAEYQVSRYDLFSFVDGDPQRTQFLMDTGFFPWWTADRLRLNFFRPLTVLTHVFDYALWPDSAPLMHLHSLLWFAALTFAAACFYRRVMGATWVAGLAALLFALDDTHGFCAAWLANRNALVATLFGLLALLAHDRWRRDRWRSGAYLGPLALALGLLSAEFALGAVAYLFSYTLFLDRDSLKSRCQSLLPHAVVFGIWAIYYRLNGYGAWGSGFYLDPVSEPFLFAGAVLERMPVLLLGQWTFPMLGAVFIMNESAVWILWTCAVLFLIWLGVVLTPFLKRDPVARFWATGMLLSLVPVCATFPHERLLLFAGLGAMGLLAQFVAAIRDRIYPLSVRLAGRISVKSMFVLLVFANLILAPLLLPLAALSPVTTKGLFELPASRLSTDARTEDQDFIFVNAINVYFPPYFSMLQTLAGQPIPRHTRMLASSATPLEITRIDERSLSIRPEGGFIQDMFSRLVRGPSSPLRVGDTVEVTGMRVEVIGTDSERRPDRALFRFDVPLEDESLRWLQYRDGLYVPFIPPAVGETVTLPAVPLIPEL